MPANIWQLDHRLPSKETQRALQRGSEATAVMTMAGLAKWTVSIGSGVHDPALEKDNDVDRIFVSVKEACSVLGIGKTTLYEILNAKEITSVRIGCRRLILLSSLKDYASRQVVGQ
jgi:excisionase family DNA binding protein